MTCPSVHQRTYHEDLRFGLVGAGRMLRASVDDPETFTAAHRDVVTFCLDELLPHLEADERWLVEARQCPRGGLLADAMRTEARAMTAAAMELVNAAGPCEAMAATRVLHSLLAAHAHHQELLVAARSAPPGDDPERRARQQSDRPTDPGPRP